MAEIQMTQADQTAIDKFKIEVVIGGGGGGGGKSIEFQFPPRVISDNKHLNWKLTDVKSYEQQAIYLSSNARKVSLEWDYIVYGQWNYTKIREQLSNIKQIAYFTQTTSTTESGFLKVKAYGLSPSDSTWRTDDIDIKYSEERILSDGDLWPLKSTVSLNIHSFTNVGDLIGGSETVYLNIPGLKLVPDFEWY